MSCLTPSNGFPRATRPRNARPCCMKRRCEPTGSARPKGGLRRGRRRRQPGITQRRSLVAGPAEASARGTTAVRPPGIVGIVPIPRFTPEYPKKSDEPEYALPLSWLRVIGTTELAQIDQRVCQQLHAIVPLLDTFKAEQQSLELVFPGKGALDAHA